MERRKLIVTENRSVEVYEPTCVHGEVWSSRTAASVKMNMPNTSFTVQLGSMNLHVNNIV